MKVKLISSLVFFFLLLLPLFEVASVEKVWEIAFFLSLSLRLFVSIFNDNENDCSAVNSVETDRHSSTSDLLKLLCLIKKEEVLLSRHVKIPCSVFESLILAIIQAIKKLSFKNIEVTVTVQPFPKEKLHTFSRFYIF